MTIAPGTRLGPYEVVALVGHGGMGEVWSARDTRLDRVVAVKVLPPELASDQQFRVRFDREAKAIAALTHPHICTLHDIGHRSSTDSGLGFDYLVMEYLEGETLERRVEKGPLPIDHALTYAIQIADALDFAHRSGIVHRDLKPGNVMLTKSGAKLLDFGLAKTMVAGPMSDLSMVPTTPPNLTAQGVILGTFQYMAPEQLEGREADARTDVFAFGSLVYEMLTGTRAFRGQSQASLIAAIMQGQPASLLSMQPLASPLLDHIVLRCLAKDPNERWQSCADLRRELQWFAAGGTTIGDRVTRPQRRGSLATTVGVAIGAAVLAVAATLWITARSNQVDPAAIRFSVQLPTGSGTPQGTLAVSPDGSKVVYDAPGPNGGMALWLRSLDRLEDKPIAGSEGASLPFWSPDGKSVAFFANRKLKKIELATGNVETIADASPSAGGGTWSRDDVILFAPFLEGSLSRVSSRGGAATTVTTLDPQHGETNHVWPHFLPDGQHYLFQLFGRDNAGIYVGALGSSERKRLIAQQSIDNTAIAYTPPGHIVYVHDHTLWAQPFDAQRLELIGEPVRIAEGFSIGGPGRPRFSISQNGVLAYRPENVGRIVQPTWIGRDGSRQETVGSPGSYLSFDLSPDGRTLAVERRSDANLDTSIWLMDVARGTATRFTNDAYAARPLWSRDGNRIVFSSARDTPPNLFVKPLSGNEERLEKVPTQNYANDWSLDGRLLYYAIDPKTKGDIWLMSLSGDRKIDSVLRTPANEVDGHLSPDGHWMAFTSDESGRNEVYVTGFPISGRKWQVSIDGATQPRWRGDGKELFFLGRQRKLSVVSIATGSTPQISPPAQLFALPPGNDFYAPANDGKRFLALPEAGASPTPVIQVVVNWMTALKH